MGLACGRIGKEEMHRADYICSIANLFCFYVRSEWVLTLLPKTVVLRSENSHLGLPISKNTGNCTTVVSHTVLLYVPTYWNYLLVKCYVRTALSILLFIIYNKPTTYNSRSIVFINNYKYTLHVSDALCVHHKEQYKL